MVAGYSRTPLAKKLGIKPGFTVFLFQQPKDYLKLFSDFPEDVDFLENPFPESADFAHAFFTSKQRLQQEMAFLKKCLKKTGMLWISWPKGSSKIATDLKREPVRDYLLSLGLVDIKVAAIDEDWSGLKFVYRTKDR